MSNLVESKEPELKAGIPYLDGNFAPVADELSVEELSVRGAIPQELSGRLLRIGPNPINPPDPASFHWFKGNGMVHGIEIKNGRAIAYKNRFVVDGIVARAQGKPLLDGPACNQDFPVNTNVLRIAGKTYALVEAGGLPIELDDDLNSVARSNFGGSLAGGFTAHPHMDPETGELHAIAYQPGVPALHYIVVDKSGRAELRGEIAAPHFPMVHDCALTKSFVVALDLPVHFSMQLAQKGKLPFAWKEGAASRLALMPRDGDAQKIEWYDLPACYVFHLMNAYETDDNKVVVDVVKHSKTFDKFQDGPREGKINLVRWLIDRTTGSVEEIELFNRGVEFPRINEAFTGKEYRFGYTAMFAGGLRFGSIFKHDLRAGSTEIHDFGSGLMAGEPVFVPRENTGRAEDEDNGWIITCVFDQAKNKSSVYILDARNFTGEAVAVIDLPARIPFGFHGNWLAD